MSAPPAIATSGASTAADRTPGRVRSVLGWVLIAALVLGVGLFTWRSAATNPAARGALDPEGNNDAGALAIVEILRDQRIEVTVVRTRDEARAAIDDDVTLAMADPYSLSDAAVLDLIEPADRIVFLSSSARLLRLLDLGEDASVFDDTPHTADCSLPELADIGVVRPERLFVPRDGVTGCFTDEAGNAGVLVDEGDGIRVSLIEGSDLFSNAHLAEDGNAALALALLGQTGHVVWYAPSFADSDIEAGSEDTLATLTPEWVTPGILLLLLAGIVATVSRGRRFGPLVAETLPVTVRASETMHGRAKLTAKAADARHAAESLRTGTIRRLARRLGLTARAAGIEVADAAADRLRVPRGSLQDLLIGPLPTDDAGLIDFSRRLAELEAAVDTAVHVERNTL
jgi:hypothetical protein